jgi:hypothetical protein
MEVDVPDPSSRV